MRRDKSALATQAAPSDPPTDSTGVPPLTFAGAGKGLSQSVMGMAHHAGGHTGVSFAKQQQSDVRLRTMLNARLQQYVAEWLLAPETRVLVKQLKRQAATHPAAAGLPHTPSTDNLGTHIPGIPSQFQDINMDSSSVVDTSYSHLVSAVLQPPRSPARMPVDASPRGPTAVDAAPPLEFTDGPPLFSTDAALDADLALTSTIRTTSKPEVSSKDLSGAAHGISGSTKRSMLTATSTLAGDTVDIDGTALLRTEDESGSDDEAASWSGSGEVLFDFALPEFHQAEARPCAVLDSATEAVIDKCFAAHPMGMKIADFETAVAVDLLGLSMYFSQVLFNRIDTEETGVITKAMLREFWRGRFILGDAANNFFYAVKEDVNDFIWPANFEALIYDILERHPGMEFLKSAPDFQKRYVDTVIGRIYYTLDTHSSGRIQLRALRNSNLVATWKRIDTETDLNNVRDYFCYEHFYVIYCKFWELDSDHDFHLDKQDLLKYDQHAFSHRAVDRIVAVASDKFTSGSPDHLSYEDFIHFLINDEDKTTDRSLEFWFRVVDIDGDGVIRDHEMAYFYEQQCERLESLCQEVVPFEDVVCQMNDLLNPARDGQYRISDFKRNRKTAGLFFNLLISLTKFIMHEQRDPFQQKQDLTDYPEWSHSEWDRFCRREYSRLAMDEDCDDDDDMQSESGHSGDQEERLNDITVPVTTAEQ